MKYADMAFPPVLFICGDTLHGHAFTPPTLRKFLMPRVRFNIVEGGELVEGAPRIVNAEDIGRVFLSELGGSAWTYESTAKRTSFTSKPWLLAMLRWATSTSP